MKEDQKRSGPPTLFPGKVRNAPITFTAQEDQHRKLNRAVERLAAIRPGTTRADVLCLLIDQHADTVAVPRKAAKKK